MVFEREVQSHSLCMISSCHNAICSKDCFVMLSGEAQLLGASSHGPKRFNSQSGHIPRLKVQSWLGWIWEGNWVMLLSYLSRFLFLPLALSLSPPPLLLHLKKKSIEKISLGEDKKIIIKVKEWFVPPYLDALVKN